jgi:predicted transcriptional regulator
MIAARVLGYGKDYEVEVNDPFTGKKQKETIDLTQFDNKPYDGSAQVAPHTNEFEFTLPRSQRVVTFMAMTESKERRVKHQVEELNKANRKLKDETSRELTTRLKTMILSVDGETDSKVISQFVDNELFAVDSKALRNYINEVVPDIDLNWEFISEETGERREMILPMDVTFFWPNS